MLRYFSSWSRRKKVVVLVLLIVPSFFVANIASAWAFDQTVENNGIIIETDKEVYRIGEEVHIRLTYVNVRQETLACTDFTAVSIRNMMGFSTAGVSKISHPDSDCYISPGSENGPWGLGAVLTVSSPGINTVAGAAWSRGGESPRSPEFTGSATILVMALP